METAYAIGTRVSILKNSGKQLTGTVETVRMINETWKYGVACDGDQITLRHRYHVNVTPLQGESFPGMYQDDNETLMSDEFLIDYPETPSDIDAETLRELMLQGLPDETPTPIAIGDTVTWKRGNESLTGTVSDIQIRTGFRECTVDLIEYPAQFIPRRIFRYDTELTKIETPRFAPGERVAYRLYDATGTGTIVRKTHHIKDWIVTRDSDGENITFFDSELFGNGENLGESFGGITVGDTVSVLKFWRANPETGTRVTGVVTELKMFGDAPGFRMTESDGYQGWHTLNSEQDARVIPASPYHNPEAGYLPVGTRVSFASWNDDVTGTVTDVSSLYGQSCYIVHPDNTGSMVRVPVPTNFQKLTVITN